MFPLLHPVVNCVGICFDPDRVYMFLKIVKKMFKKVDKELLMKVFLFQKVPISKLFSKNKQTKQSGIFCSREQTWLTKDWNNSMRHSVWGSKSLFWLNNKLLIKKQLCFLFYSFGSFRFIFEEIPLNYCLLFIMYKWLVQCTLSCILDPLHPPAVHQSADLVHKPPEESSH